MAETETLATTNGTGNADDAREQIEVENPATGEVAGTVPRMLPEDVAEMVARGRRAQPGWEALGFDGPRARAQARAGWVLNNSERIIRTIVSETGKTWEDAQLAEVGYAAPAFGFWAKNAEKYLSDEKIKSASPFLLGRRSWCATARSAWWA